MSIHENSENKGNNDTKGQTDYIGNEDKQNSRSGVLELFKGALSRDYFPKE
jgi:hypothetical protein